MRKLRWLFVALTLAADAAPAATVCNIDGIGAELSEFHLTRCDGALDHREAVDCVNRLAKEAATQRQRAARAQAQAECLCKALNETVGGFGIYSRISGRCSVEK